MKPTMLQEAIRIATEAHKGQVDKANQPYINHLVRVTSLVKGEEAKTVAMLHDVVEDTEITLEELSEIFPTYIVAAVNAVSRRKNETYFEFIARAASNNLGQIVKQADVQDHINNSEAIPASLIKRYQKAISILLSTSYKVEE